MFLYDWWLKNTQPIAAIQNLTKQKKKTTQKIPKSEKTTKQLLGEFYTDKKYLENLLKDEGTPFFYLVILLASLHLADIVRCSFKC